MKAEEIRNRFGDTALALALHGEKVDDAKFNVSVLQVAALGEIAAQLAELNGKFTKHNLTSTTQAQCHCSEGMGKCISCRIGKQ
jgi:hypothetical protein